MESTENDNGIGLTNKELGEQAGIVIEMIGSLLDMCTMLRIHPVVFITEIDYLNLTNRDSLPSALLPGANANEVWEGIQKFNRKRFNSTAPLALESFSECIQKFNRKRLKMKDSKNNAYYRGVKI